MKKSFDQYAQKYDSWFLDNSNVLMSEVKLVAKTLEGCENIVSVGCGSGLFESILRQEFGIHITDGVEPSKDMAAIAAKRGLEVMIETAENYDYLGRTYDTILYNGCPGYITDLGKALTNSFNALNPGGKVIVIDIPKESGYGLLYNLAKAVKSWDHPLLTGVYPRNPYPIELVDQANWHTTGEKIDLMEKVGFVDFEFYQTLTTHPVYSDLQIEEPISGFDKGDYVAICAYKPK
ncbi:SAM-dependent methyltransferase [Wohlfahrtiimonas chitiniclastica]|uniref:class I SAM-dependent DNA methyltransferase n=1 Tax=Wohlfahrtiimonas chitiniclastica TaxID=400946 RepID=UPI000B991E94|nr:class I SAM-dependent methyltransferase [Wohlfahrtiimonas chitiniclastica]OYQ88306.1 SAM-dependent methyltransferase [Wohlfahrtiimonas chitiniclastica]